MARLEEWLPRVACFGAACTESAYRPALRFECERAGVSRGARPLSCALAVRSAGDDVERMREFGVFAIMIDAEQYLSCDRLIARSTGRVQVAPGDGEVEVHLREHLRIFARALGLQRDRAAADFLAALLPGSARRHRPCSRRCRAAPFPSGAARVVAAAFGRAIHRDEVAAAGLGGKRHAVLAHPAYFAFHACTPALPDSDSIRHCSPLRNGRLMRCTTRNAGAARATRRTAISRSDLGVLL